LIYVRQRFVSLQEYQHIGYGALIVTMVVFAPSGLAGLGTSIWRRVAPARFAASPLEATLDEDDVEGLGADAGRLTAVSLGGAGVDQRQESGDVLEIRGVTKRFKGVVALDDVSIDVRGGTIHGIVGPNGSGKTTLFNIVTGVYGPTDGAVLLYGRRISGRRAYRVARRGVARTFQGVRLFRSLTVRENIMVALDDSGPLSNWRYLVGPWLVLRRERELRRRADRHLNRYRLGSVADFLGTNLPYGQQRLVEIARAMASNPKLLLLDEPAAGLNSTEMRDLGELIRGIRETGATVLLIEHNMGLVMSLCERVTVLASGRVLADGVPETISRDPHVIEAYLGKGASRDVEASLA
jgi:branched-chain amino acid transport system permease protein